MLPFVIAAVTGIVIAAYFIAAIGSVGDYIDPHDWTDAEGDDEG